MANPGVPQPRKNATSGFNPKNASATSAGPGKSAYNRKSATPFGNPKKGDLLKRTPSGLSPDTHKMNRDGEKQRSYLPSNNGSGSEKFAD